MLFIEHLLELEPLWLQKLPQAIGSSMVKNLPANAADARDTGLARVFSLQNLSLLGSLCSCVCELSLPFLPPGSGSHWALTWYGDHVSPSPGISETSWSTPPSDLLYYSSLLTGYQEDANEDGWESLEVIPTILSFQSNLDVISYKDSPHYLPHLNSIAVNMKRKMNTLLPIKDLCLAFQI